MTEQKPELDWATAPVEELISEAQRTWDPNRAFAPGESIRDRAQALLMAASVRAQVNHVNALWEIHYEQTKRGF